MPIHINRSSFVHVSEFSQHGIENSLIIEMTPQAEVVQIKKLITGNKKA